MTRQTKIIIATVVISILGLILLAILSAPTSTPSPTTPVLPISEETTETEVNPLAPQVIPPSHTNIDQLANKLNAATSEEEITKIPSLPIYIQDFSTSRGKTTINIYTLPGEPKSILHLEIYGPNYNYTDISTDNPHAVMFYESFNEAKQQLMKIGVDPRKINFVYGTRQYIQDTSTNWVEVFGLLK